MTKDSQDQATCTIPNTVINIKLGKNEHTWGESDRLGRDAEGYRIFGSYCDVCGTNTESDLAKLPCWVVERYWNEDGY